MFKASHYYFCSDLEGYAGKTFLSSLTIHVSLADLYSFADLVETLAHEEFHRTLALTVAFFPESRVHYVMKRLDTDLISGDSRPSPELGEKRCAVYDEPVVEMGTGCYYGGRLIHRACRGVARIQHHRLAK